MWWLFFVCSARRMLFAGVCIRGCSALFSGGTFGVCCVFPRFAPNKRWGFSPVIGLLFRAGNYEDTLLELGPPLPKCGSSLMYPLGVFLRLRVIILRSLFGGFFPPTVVWFPARIPDSLRSNRLDAASPTGADFLFYTILAAALRFHIFWVPLLVSLRTGLIMEVVRPSVSPRCTSLLWSPRCIRLCLSLGCPKGRRADSTSFPSCEICPLWHICCVLFLRPS